MLGDGWPRPNPDQDWRLFWREYHAGLYRAEVHVTIKLALDLLLVRVPPSPSPSPEPHLTP